MLHVAIRGIPLPKGGKPRCWVLNQYESDRQWRLAVTVEKPGFVVNWLAGFFGARLGELERPLASTIVSQRYINIT
jgi:hypothetical protein